MPVPTIKTYSHHPRCSPLLYSLPRRPTVHAQPPSGSPVVHQHLLPQSSCHPPPTLQVHPICTKISLCWTSSSHTPSHVMDHASATSSPVNCTTSAALSPTQLTLLQVPLAIRALSAQAYPWHQMLQQIHILLTSNPFLLPQRLHQSPPHRPLRCQSVPTSPPTSILPPSPTTESMYSPMTPTPSRCPAEPERTPDDQPSSYHSPDTLLPPTIL